jgi:hypothetical protein
MSTYRVRFTVPAEVVVELDAPDEETAEDRAHDMARNRLSEVAAYSNGVGVFGDVDGIGPDETTEVSR